MLLQLLRTDFIQNRSPLSNRQIKAQETDLPALSSAFIDTLDCFSLHLSHQLINTWQLMLADGSVYICVIEADHAALKKLHIIRAE